MIFNRPQFGEQYDVYSDIYIDDAGIHDGHVVHEWCDMQTCSIGESDPVELKRYFGENYDERPYAINILRKNGKTHSITLFGQGWEKAVLTGLAINHFSGRKLIAEEKLKSGSLPTIIIISVLMVAALMVILAIICNK